jgi:8-oxo-dGTP pyrophosphatase MutT (NUDIX family)
MIFFDQLGNQVQKPEGVEAPWRVSVYALVVRADGRILANIPTSDTRWELPGGGVEVEESLESALKRECWEETGYRLVSMDPMPWDVSERGFYDKKYSRFYHALILIFRAQVEDLPPPAKEEYEVDQDEIAKVEWVNVELLKEENCHPIIWPAIERLQKASAAV